MPPRVVLDVINPVAKAIMRAKDGKVALGAATGVVRLGRAVQSARTANPVNPPATALTNQRLTKGSVRVEVIDVL